jgi:hypothetical protein
MDDLDRIGTATSIPTITRTAYVTLRIPVKESLL